MSPYELMCDTSQQLHCIITYYHSAQQLLCSVHQLLTYSPAQGFSANQTPRALILYFNLEWQKAWNFSFSPQFTAQTYCRIICLLLARVVALWSVHRKILSSVIYLCRPFVEVWQQSSGILLATQRKKYRSKRFNITQVNLWSRTAHWNCAPTMDLSCTSSPHLLHVDTHNQCPKK